MRDLRVGDKDLDHEIAIIINTEWKYLKQVFKYYPEDMFHSLAYKAVITAIAGNR